MGAVGLWVPRIDDVEANEGMRFDVAVFVFQKGVGCGNERIGLGFETSSMI